MKVLVALAICVAALFPSYSNAASGPQNYGRYYCGDCNISDGEAAIGDIYIFLRSTKITDQWVPGDLVTVCDGTSCIPITWRGTTWFPVGPPYPDPKSSYKNDLSVIDQPYPGAYDVVVIWISPSGPALTGTVTVGDLIVVGPDAGGGTGKSGEDSVEDYSPDGTPPGPDPGDAGANSASGDSDGIIADDSGYDPNAYDPWADYYSYFDEWG